jgi:hypothetical protein
MNTQELAQKTADLTDLSNAEVSDLIDQMDADQIINLTMAVHDDDADAIQHILDQVDSDSESEAQTVPEIKAEIQSLGRKLLKLGDDLTDLWPLIGKLTAADWKMVWPSVDEDIMQKLYQEATDKETDTISAADATMLHDYSISYIAESMVIYENAWWQVKVPQAPDNLVGICQDHQLIWVPRSQLQLLHEHVLGMTAMPSLARMKELAGICPDVVHAPHVQAQQIGSHSPVETEWLQQLRMHMTEIEKLHAAPSTPDSQEEIQLHVRALSRKAREASEKMKAV